MSLSKVSCLTLVKLQLVYHRGPFLGPLLFVIYINDLPSVLSNSEILMYADDTLIFREGTEVCKIKQDLSDDLENVYLWFKDNMLHLHNDKTKSVLFGTPFNER